MEKCVDQAFKQKDMIKLTLKKIEMQIKTILRYYLLLRRLAIVKKTDFTKWIVKEDIQMANMYLKMSSKQGKYKSKSQ